MGNFIDLRGHIFKRLTALRRVENNKQGKAVWRCICSCGILSEVSAANLRSGDTKSCGCLNRDMDRTLLKEIKTTHGMSRTKIYGVWTGMIQRCTNQKDTSYKNYGGRGIKVCERWLTFENFLADMGAPGEGMTIERLDNEKGYSLENCTFASRTVQARNKRVRKDSKSGCTGVNWHKASMKWYARIDVDERRISLGTFESLEDAIASRMAAELEYWTK